MTIDELTYQIIRAAMTVHSAIGAGSLERVYDTALYSEFQRLGLQFEHQARISASFRRTSIPAAFRADYIVEKCVLVEIKAVEKLHPVHHSQLRSYLKLAKLTVGLLINFNVVHLRDGTHRAVNGYQPGQEI